MNMMNNQSQIENLSNMKTELANIESRFNLAINQLQNMGINPGTSYEFICVSLELINFGIQMLSKGTQMNDDRINNIRIKQQIEYFGKNLINISTQIPYPKYNIKFEIFGGNNILISEDVDTTVDELIKKFLNKIGRNDLFDREEKEYNLLYNAIKLNTKENKSKKLIHIFASNVNPRIECYKLFEVLGKK